MNKILNKILILFLFLFFNSCNEYQKVLRNDDIKLKYEMAESFYKKNEWRKASALFEQIQPNYRGKPQGERITYFYANSLLETKNYVLAAYQFENFIKSYPISQKVEEAAFLSALCAYKQSPRYSLDQDLTSDAINKLQSFINSYPYSDRLSEANKLVQELRIKLEKKAFEIAKQYNTIRDYKSAIKVLNSFISDFPGTTFREDALYFLFDASYLLAINSIESKKNIRLLESKKIYEELINDYPDSKYIVDLEKRILLLDKEIAIFATN